MVVSITPIEGPPDRTRPTLSWERIVVVAGARVWEVDAGTFWANFGGYGEFVIVATGEMDCTADADGSVVTLKDGDVIVFPRDWTSWWAIKRRMRKLSSTWQHD
jgi:uncharacterized cupin superfamily protein